MLSFDLVSYLSGLSRISYVRFLLATAIGMLPNTFAWTIFGHDLAYAETSVWRLAFLGLFVVVAAIGGRWWLRRHSLTKDEGQTTIREIGSSSLAFASARLTR